MQYHATPCRTMQYHALPCNTIHYQAIPCNTMPYNAIPCSIMQYHVVPCNTMKYHSIPCNTKQYHAIPGNTMQYHVVPFNTIQYHSIPCHTMQFHASMITADGAYHCPMGSIWPFLATKFPSRIWVQPFNQISLCYIGCTFIWLLFRIEMFSLRIWCCFICFYLAKSVDQC